MLYWQIKAWLNANNIPHSDTDFELEDAGEGPFIREWNEAKLGPWPARADLDALQAEAAALQAEAAVDPQAELDAAISAAIEDEPANSPVRKLGEALLGQAGKAGRIAGRPV